MSTPQLVTPAGTPVGRLGYGCMNLTWAPKQTPDEQAFEAIKTAVDGGSTFLNCELSFLLCVQGCEEFGRGSAVCSARSLLTPCRCSPPPASHHSR